MTRPKITIYVSEEEKRQLESEADENDQAISEYGKQLLDRGRMAEAEETLTSRTDVEAAIERTIEETIAEYQEDLLAAVEKSSVYSIANYELDATTADASGATRQDTFATGRRRTHTPLSEHEETMAADSASETDASDPSKGSTSASDDSSSGSLKDQIQNRRS